MEIHNCINYLLSVSQHVVFKNFNNRLAHLGVTPAQYGVLSCLWTHGTLTPKQIGQELFLEASSISGVLERMQKNDLITREIDPSNRRTILVTATEKSLVLKEDVNKIVEELNSHFLDEFSLEEKEAFRNFLKTIINK